MFGRFVSRPAAHHLRGRSRWAVSERINPYAPRLTAPATATATQGSAFTLSPSADRPVRSWAATGLPAGLSIHPRTGAISGTPTASGSFSIAITASTGTAAGDGSLGDLNPPLLVNVDANQFPFDLNAAALAASPKKVFAHWFPPYPRSIDNVAPSRDYWQRNWLNDGPLDPWEAHHAAYGGFHRQRPAPRLPLAGDWEYADLVEDCRLAKAAGFDGFTVNILAIHKGAPLVPPAFSDGNTQWNRLMKLWDAAAEVGIALVPMPDMSAHFGTHPEDFVWVVQQLAPKPATYRLGDGRVVVAPYFAQAQTPTWWDTELNVLSALSIDVFLIPLIQNWTAYKTAFAPVSDGFAEWGDRTVAGSLNYLTADYAGQAHALGKVWFAPVGLSDVRSKSQTYVEVEASAGHRAAWRAAIEGGADWAQIITWNDYSEASEIRPSTGVQGNWYLLAAYHAAWFKLGAPPAIVRDRLVYFHRTHFAADVAGPAWTAAPMVPDRAGPLVDVIELVGFLAAPGRLEILVDGVVVAWADRPAGLQVLTAPLAAGRPSFRLSRNGAAVLATASLWTVGHDIDFYDFLYRGADSTAIGGTATVTVEVEVEASVVTNPIPPRSDPLWLGFWRVEDPAVDRANIIPGGPPLLPTWGGLTMAPIPSGTYSGLSIGSLGFLQHGVGNGDAAFGGDSDVFGFRDASSEAIFSPTNQAVPYGARIAVLNGTGVSIYDASGAQVASLSLGSPLSVPIDQYFGLQEIGRGTIFCYRGVLSPAAIAAIAAGQLPP